MKFLSLAVLLIASVSAQQYQSPPPTTYQSPSPTTYQSQPILPPVKPGYSWSQPPAYGGWYPPGCSWSGGRYGWAGGHEKAFGFNLGLPGVGVNVGAGPGGVGVGVRAPGLNVGVGV